MDSIDIFTLNKSKTPISISGIEAYMKEQLATEIQRFITVNTQLMTDKMETERTKVNLEIDRVRLLGEKNFLVVKRKELRAEIVAINAVGSFNTLVYNQQDPFIRSV